MRVETLSLTPASLAAVYLTSVLLVFLVAAMLALGIFARTYREAIIYFGPLDLLVMSPLSVFLCSISSKPRTGFLSCPAGGLLRRWMTFFRGSSRSLSQW